jgi:hypothetical protein
MANLQRNGELVVAHRLSVALTRYFLGLPRGLPRGRFSS